MSNDDSQAPLNEGIRINKYLASCGYESRRKADQLIADGVVEINGKRVETPGVRVLPGDFVKVNGHHAQPKEEVTLLLNKPRGFVCSREAQGAEGTVYDLLPPKYRYVNYVGRLDADSEGLLIFTNKGELSQHLGHPNNGVEKEYWVTLNQTFENSVLLQLLKGVRIPEGQAKAKYISRLSPRRACVVLEQGLKRQVRQMFACLGFRVRKLVRVRIGSLWGGDLAPGRAMLLTPEQEKLAATNPPQRKGMINAAQAFPKSGTASAEQLARALDEKAARAALEEETNYHFNPADFESEEEAEGDRFSRSWDEYDFAAPARRRERGFYRVPHDSPSAGREPRRPARRSQEEPREYSPRKRSFGDRRRESYGRREDAGAREQRFSHREPGKAPRRFQRDDTRRSEASRAPRRFHSDSARGDWGSNSDRPSRSPRSNRQGGSRSGFGRSASRPGGFGRPRNGGRPSSPGRGKRF